MFRLLILILTVLLVISHVSADIIQNFTMNFSVSDFKFENNEHGELVIIPEDPQAVYPDNNEPGLPRISWNIAIRGESSYGSSSFTLSKRLIKSDVIIEQSPTQIPTDSITYSSYQPITYDIRTYPDSTCQYAWSSDWGSVKVLHFIVSPFIYDAQTKELYFVDKIDLTVSLTEADNNSTSSPLDNIRKEFIKSIVSNKEDIYSREDMDILIL